MLSLKLRQLQTYLMLLREEADVLTMGAEAQDQLIANLDDMAEEAERLEAGDTLDAAEERNLGGNVVPFPRGARS